MKAPARPTEEMILTDDERAAFDSRIGASGNAGSCTLWIARRSSTGYGTFRLVRDGIRRSYYAHRIVAVQNFGTFDPALEVDHICHNRLCVNGDHLRTATQKQNQENRIGANASSATGVRGVRWEANVRRWVGEVRHHDYAYRTPYFDTIAEADAAVRALRLELFTHSQEVAS